MVYYVYVWLLKVNVNVTESQKPISQEECLVPKRATVASTSTPMAWKLDSTEDIESLWFGMNSSTTFT